MAREIANIRLSMWADRDWQALSRGAQHLYMYLLSSPSLSYAGVCDWRPNRIVVRSADWSIEELEADRAELEKGHFIYVYVCASRTLFSCPKIKKDSLFWPPNIYNILLRRTNVNR